MTFARAPVPSFQTNENDPGEDLEQNETLSKDNAELRKQYAQFNDIVTHCENVLQLAHEGHNKDAWQASINDIKEYVAFKIRVEGEKSVGYLLLKTEEWQSYADTLEEYARKQKIEMPKKNTKLSEATRIYNQAMKDMASAVRRIPDWSADEKECWGQILVYKERAIREQLATCKNQDEYLRTLEQGKSYWETWSNKINAWMDETYRVREENSDFHYFKMVHYMQYTNAKTIPVRTWSVEHINYGDYNWAYTYFRGVCYGYDKQEQQLYTLNMKLLDAADSKNDQIWFPITDSETTDQLASFANYPDHEHHILTRSKYKNTIVKDIEAHTNADKELAVRCQEHLQQKSYTEVVALYRTLKDNYDHASRTDLIKLDSVIEELEKRRHEQFTHNQMVYVLLDRPETIEIDYNHGHMTDVVRQRALEKGALRFLDYNNDGKKEWVVQHRWEKWTIPFSQIRSETVGGRSIHMMWLPDELEKSDGGQTSGIEEIRPPKTIQEQFMQRKYTYLDQNCTMTQEQCDNLFREFKQLNLGNCYMLSYIRSLSRDHRDAMFRTSIRQVPGGYEVKIPLSSSKGKTIKVLQSDIDEPQKIYQNGQWIDIHPIDGSDGWKVLEAAYILYAWGRDRYGKPDRIKADAYEGEYTKKKGSVDTHFLYGEEEGITKYMYTSGSKAFASEPKLCKAFFQVLDNFWNGRDCLRIGSRSDTSRKFYCEGNELVRGHAYTVQRVDKQNREVYILNPHDTSVPLKFSYQGLATAFNGLNYTPLDYTKIFT